MEPDPDSPSSPSTRDGPAGRRTRVRRWLLAYGLHVETLLALLVLVLIPVTVGVVLFGAMAAYPGGPPPEAGESETNSILEFGFVLINGLLWVTAGLGVFVLVHGAVELWTAVRSRSGRGDGGGIDLAYVAVRTVQTVAAVAFVGRVFVEGLLAGLDIQSVTIPGSGLLLLASVLAHAAGRAVRSVAGSVRSQ